MTILKRSMINNILIIPLIWAPFVFVLVCHIVIEIYQQLAFRLYNIPFVNIGDFIFFDREKMSYLKWYEKINCAYCAYVNGGLLYMSAIAKRTEWYWCRLRHIKNPNNPAFAYMQEFIDPNDYKTYVKHKKTRDKHIDKNKVV